MKKILIGGVPFGCDNVGDEAILESALAILRDACPGASFTVSTRDEEGTARAFGVATCRLLGFFNEVSPEQTRAIIAAHDAFVWCGATGLSDYPECTLEIMRIAHEAGKKTVLWGVGMNSELNPNLYRVLPGRRRRLLSSFTKAAAGLVDFVKVQEAYWDRRARRAIARELNAAGLVVVRDPESRDELLRCGVTRAIVVGADSALTLKSAALDSVSLSAESRAILASGNPKVGLCISAQREIKQRGELLGYLNRLLAETDASIVCIPMNPLTDAALMTQLAAETSAPGRVTVIAGRHDPGAILAVASRMDVVVSSRLHLLILASIAHVPIIGIARGSKVDNFLKPFGLKSVGDVDDCNFDLLWSETMRLLEHRGAFEEKSIAVRAEFLSRLDRATALLKAALAD